jgi:hypothetical protein
MPASRFWFSPHRWVPGIAKFGSLPLIVRGVSGVDVGRLRLRNRRLVARRFVGPAFGEIAHALLRLCFGRWREEENWNREDRAVRRTTA